MCVHIHGLRLEIKTDLILVDVLIRVLWLQELVLSRSKEDGASEGTRAIQVFARPCACVYMCVCPCMCIPL